MTLIRDIGLHHIARQHFLQFSTLVDMNLLLFTVVILDVVVLPFRPHQGALDRVFRQTLFKRRRNLPLTKIFRLSRGTDAQESDRQQGQ